MPAGVALGFFALLVGEMFDGGASFAGCVAGHFWLLSGFATNGVAWAMMSLASASASR